MNIWCIGRNYTEHIKELGNKPSSSPLIFLKAESTIADNSNITLPFHLGRIDYETELVVKLNKNLEICAYTIGIDLTARDIQDQLKKKGHPWAAAKSFSNACLLGDFYPCTWEYLNDFSFTMSLNGVIKQEGKIKNMIYSLKELLTHLQSNYPLQANDILMTGTPAGVGPISSGDQIKVTDSLGNQFSWQII
jgi:2-keto-4-pentenoate hydratase/2-oxohepta-3-ene-1,7-dioic acid hydratase in catechol pathway